MPKIIKKINKAVKVPIITGGLIEDKEDIINALGSGAMGISTTKKNYGMYDKMTKEIKNKQKNKK